MLDRYTTGPFLPNAYIIIFVRCQYVNNHFHYLLVTTVTALALQKLLYSFIDYCQVVSL